MKRPPVTTGAGSGSWGVGTGFGTSHDPLLGIQEIPVLVLTVHRLQPPTIGSIRVDPVSQSRADVLKGAGLPLGGVLGEPFELRVIPVEGNDLVLADL